jgi:hypothetical protein
MCEWSLQTDGAAAHSENPGDRELRGAMPRPLAPPRQKVIRIVLSRWTTGLQGAKSLLFW